LYSLLISTLKQSEKIKMNHQDFTIYHGSEILLITLFFSFLGLLLNFLPNHKGHIIIWILPSSLDLLYTWSWCLKIADNSISASSKNNTSTPPNAMYYISENLFCIFGPICHKR
jgi:hypothetical protein